MTLFAGRRSGKKSTEELLPSRTALAQLTKGDMQQRALSNYAKLTPSGLGTAETAGVGLNPVARRGRS